MKKNISSSLVLLCGFIILSGCHAKKQLVTRKPVDSATVATNNAANTKRKKLDAIRSRQATFNTFSGKAKTKLDINGNSNDVTLNIRIQRNQKIWVSVTAIAGIEVARALITPDSIQVINRLQSVYIKKPFGYIHTFSSQQVNYKTVESLLVGNAIPELLNNDADLRPNNGSVVLSGTLQDLVYQLTVGPDLKVSNTNLSNQAAGQSLQINYSDFIQATNRVMPSKISFTSTVKDKNIKADLQYTKADFDQQLDFPFSVPKRYEEVN